MIDILKEKDDDEEKDIKANDVIDPNEPQPRKRGRKKGKKVGPYKKRGSKEKDHSRNAKKINGSNGNSSDDDDDDESEDGDNNNDSSNNNSGSNSSNSSSSSSDEDRGEDVYDVESILDVVVEEGVRYYYVKWAGYDEMTWEPEENCVGCERKIREFYKRRGEASKKGRRKSKK